MGKKAKSHQPKKVRRVKKLRSRTVSMGEFLKIVDKNLKIEKNTYRAVAFDFEALGATKNEAVDPRFAKPDLLSVATRDTWEHPVPSKAPIVSAVFRWNEETRKFLLKLSFKKIWLIAHNAYYDIPLAVFNKGLPRRLNLGNAMYLDTILNCWLLQEELPLGLKDQVRTRLGIEMITYEDLFSEYAGLIKPIMKRLDNLDDEFVKKKKRERVKVNKQINDVVFAEWEKIKDIKAKERVGFKTKKDIIEHYNVIKEKKHYPVSDKRVLLQKALMKELLENKLESLKTRLERDYIAYSERDSVTTLKLFDTTKRELVKKKLWSWYRVEAWARMCSLQMLIDGVHIDIEKLNSLRQEADAALEKLTKKAFEIAGKEFLLTSPQQIQQMLWEECKAVPPMYAPKSANGKTATDAKTLERTTHPLAQAILDFRAAETLIKNFFRHIPKSVELDPWNAGRNHVVMNTTGTKTGRWSSKGLALTPGQLQNIPSRSKPKQYAPEVQNLGPKIRETFVPKSFNIGTPMLMIVGDFSQIELRLAAHFTRDPNMVRAYTEHVKFENIIAHTGDLHRMTAKLTKSIRKDAKCLDGDTLVNTRDGLTSIGTTLSHLSYDSHEPVDAVALSDGRGGFVSSNSGVKRSKVETVTVVTKRGVVCCSEDHRFILEDGSLKEAKNLLPNDRLKLAKFEDQLSSKSHRTKVAIDFFQRKVGEGTQTITLDKDWAYFAGMFAGDGHRVSSHACGITYCDNNEPDNVAWREIVHAACKKIGLPISPRKNKKGVGIGSRIVTRFFDHIGLSNKSHLNKTMRIPDWVLKGGPKYLWNYIGGMIDTDGTAPREDSTATVSITQKDPEFIGQLAFVLRLLGCDVTIELSYNKKYKRNYYRLRILTIGMKKLLDAGALRHPKKVRRLATRCKKICYAKKMSNDKVLAVITSGVRDVYDFEVDNKDHIYCQGGLLGHNSQNFGLIYGMSTQGFVVYARLFIDDEYIDVYNNKVVSFTSWKLGENKEATRELLAADKAIDRYVYLYGRQPYMLDKHKMRLAEPKRLAYDFFKGDDMRSSYHKTYASLFAHQNKIRAQYNKGQRTWKTLCGRERHFELYDRVSPGTIFNSIIQGSAADWAKLCIALVYKYMSKEMGITRPLLQVHDEYMFETLAVRKSDAVHAATMVKAIMDYSLFKMRVPFLGDVTLCKDWSAKDDDTIPPIGQFYAVVDGKERLFNYDNWQELVEAEAEDKDREKKKLELRITNKAAVASLPNNVLAKFHRKFDGYMSDFYSSKVNVTSIDEWRKTNGT